MNALMSNHSLEEIKTVDICSKAGISRQTFYRNFTINMMQQSGLWRKVR